MTLYRQLLLFILIILFFLFAGTWFVKLNTTRSFLMEQLESHAQDTATSLGLSISSLGKEMNVPAMETMINAIFDRGYYRSIHLTDMEDTPLVDRALEPTIEGVPTWFSTLFPVKTPVASSMIMSGWQQFGFIYVESHPGYAYQTLWNGALRTAIWFTITGAFVALIGGIGLRIILRPLKRVEQQALALRSRKYTIQKRIPKTRELRQVVEAMNTMTGDIKKMFEEQAGVAERLRKNVFRDYLTKLGNRRYLEHQVAARLDRKADISKGAFLLLHIKDLQDLNEKKGFQAGDALIIRVAQIIRELCKEMPSILPGRLTGGDFALFLPDAETEDADQTAQSLLTALKDLHVEQLALDESIASLGGVTYNRSTSYQELLSAADTALQGARQAGINQAFLHELSDAESTVPQGKMEWKKTLQDVLADKSVQLFTQPTVLIKKKEPIFHCEVFSRVPDTAGTLLSAGLFIPLAERLHLTAEFDRLIIETAAKLTIKDIGTERIAINLSPRSLQDEDFTTWLLTTLQYLPPAAPRFDFELSEISIVEHMERVKTFARAVRQAGHGFGIDHYGQSFSNFGYLQSLRPDYVKIDRAYTSKLEEKDGDTHFFISSLCSVAHSLGILVIAEGVENEQQWQLLKELNLDAIQGYYIACPEAIEQT